MPDYQSILADASRLSVTDRLQLIDDLAATVPDEHSHDLSPEWLAEIDRRSDEIDGGRVETEDWSVIRDRLFAKYGVRNAD